MRTPFFSFILYKVGVTMERFVLQKYTFRFGLAIRFVLRIINGYNAISHLIDNTRVRERICLSAIWCFIGVRILPLYNLLDLLSVLLQKN